MDLKMLYLLTVGVLGSAISELETENQELRTANEILHNQLMELSKMTDLKGMIEEDFEYNKEKLRALLDEFSSEKSDDVKLTLSDQVVYYLKVLSQDLKILGGSSEGINSSELDSLITSFNHATEEFRSKKLTQEFNTAYQELKKAISHKDSSLTSLQIENSKLISSLDSAFADLEQLSQKYSHESQKLESITQDLDQTKSDQKKRLENLKASLQSEESTSRTKEINDYQKIQKSQDDLIHKLQTKNTEQSLKIEELAMTKVSLLSKIRLLSNTIERLENEIKARNNQIDVSENKFEEFKRQIEYETNNEIISLRNSEEVLKIEVEQIQRKQMDLLEAITNCTKQLDAIEMEKRQKENAVKEIELSIEEARNGIKAAKEGRTQEIEILQQKLKEDECVLNTLQNQLDEALLKISAQNSEIRELSEKITEFQFLTENVQPRTNLRAFMHS